MLRTNKPTQTLFMKRITLMHSIPCVLLLSSCCTIFTGSRQNITFSGPEGTKIYDYYSSNLKLAEIGASGTATVSIKKEWTIKYLQPKKRGTNHKLSCLSRLSTALVCGISFSGRDS